MNSSTPDQFDEWYENEHSSSDVEIEEDTDDLDTGTYNSEWNQL